MRHYQLPDAEALGLPFSSAVRVGDLLFLSGALGNLPGTMTLAGPDMKSQARQTMDNVGAVLKHCGLGFDDIVKATVMLADMAEWPEFNAVYVTYFPRGRLPARSAFGCTGLALGGRLELECVARYQ